MSVEAMRRGGIVRPDEVVELARAARLDLAAACVLLVKESGGGQNLWGADPVVVAPGTYRKRGTVTRESYTAYLAAVRAGRAGRQGVGPCQLTASDYQDAADRAGGCWDWRANCLVGFSVLAGHIARYGERGGFVAYNGGPGALTKAKTHPAQLYGDDAVRKLAAWRPLLADIDQKETDVALTDDEIERIARRCADLTITRPTKNAFDGVVGFDQIVNGVERRTADVQKAVDLLRESVRPVAATGGVDLDALADRVVERLAYRLAGGK